MNIKRFFSRIRLMITSKVFVRSSQLEREVRLKLESMLPADFKVEKASKYTESDEEFTQNEKLKETPPDYFIFCKNVKVAIIEVTQGVPGYTVAKSHFIKISENKLEPLKRDNIQSYLIMVVIEEHSSSKERYIWCTPEIIEKCPSEEEYVGVKWKEWLRVYRVPIDKWKIGLKTFVDELMRLTD